MRLFLSPLLEVAKNFACWRDLCLALTLFGPEMLDYHLLSQVAIFNRYFPSSLLFLLCLRLFLALLQSVFLPGSHQILKLLNLSNWLATRSFCLISFFLRLELYQRGEGKPYLNLVGDCSQALFPPISEKLGTK